MTEFLVNRQDFLSTGIAAEVYQYFMSMTDVAPALGLHGLGCQLEYRWEVHTDLDSTSGD